MIFIADLHLSRFNDTILMPYMAQIFGDASMIPSRMYDTLMRLREAIDYASNTSQSLVIGGDVFDSSRPPLWVVAYLFKEFEYAYSKGVEIWIIPGNHDCDVSWGPKVLGESGHTNIHYVDMPVIAQVDGMEVGFVPHLPRSIVETVERMGETFPGFVRKHLGDSVEVMVSHAHAMGAKNSSDVEIEAGEAIAFNPEQFPDFKVGLFGHIHRAQGLDVSKGQSIYYPGAVSVCDYSEAENELGFMEMASGKVPVFREFSHKGKEYKHIRIDLISKDSAEFPKDKVEALVKDKLVKITVYTNDPLKVEEWPIRKAFNEFGYVTRFETVIQREGSDAEFDEEEPIISYESLYGTWLANKDGVSQELRLEAMEIGKTIIAKVLAKEAINA